MTRSSVFLQILAGLTNTSIVRDPVGYVGLGARVRVPFVLNEADINCRVILLTEYPVVRLSIETPDWKIIDPANAASFGTRFETANTVRTASFGLPLAFQAQRIQSGTWHALLELDQAIVKKLQAGENAASVNVGQSLLRDLRTKGAKFCLSTHAFSNLRMTASLSQSGHAPGATLYVRAVLTGYGQPVDRRARVAAEIQHPDGSRVTVSLAEVSPGVFGASFVAQQAGIYRMTLRAEGGTFRGHAFTREQLLTVAVWPRGDQPTTPPIDGNGGARFDACELLRCLLSDRVLTRELQERLKKAGFNVDGLRRCVDTHCGKGAGHVTR